MSGLSGKRPPTYLTSVELILCRDGPGSGEAPLTLCLILDSHTSLLSMDDREEGGMMTGLLEAALVARR